MIAHGIGESGETLLVLGLEPRNLELLQQGKPIVIPAGNEALKSAGLGDVRIVVMFGTSLEALQQMIPTDSKTKMIDHRRKPS